MLNINYLQYVFKQVFIFDKSAILLVIRSMLVTSFINAVITICSACYTVAPQVQWYILEMKIPLG